MFREGNIRVSGTVLAISYWRRVEQTKHATILKTRDELRRSIREKIKENKFMSSRKSASVLRRNSKFL